MRINLRKNFNRKIGLALIICMSFYLNASTSDAYVKLGIKWGSSKIKYCYENFISTRAKNYYTKAANAWNNCNLDASLYSTSQKNVTCIEKSDSKVTWDGLTTYSSSGKKFTSATVYLNKSQDAWNSDGALQSVAAHEFGHIFGLKDNGKTKTLMNGYTYGTNSRYGTYKIKTPTSDDKNGVNAIY